MYRCDFLGGTVGGNFGKELIGFKKLTLRELLNIGDPPADGEEADKRGMERTENDNEKGNVILNMKESSLPTFFVPASQDVVSDPRFNPNSSKFRPAHDKPPWPVDKDDGRNNFNPMDPYRGMQCVALDRDAQCQIGADDHAGFVWVSLKMYLPSRTNCRGPHKGGPPILSPFTKWNQLPIPTPAQLGCTGYFALRVHTFQAKDLPSANATGMANAFVRVRFKGKEMRSHVVHGSNSPTWDTTIKGPAFMELTLPSLGWPGECGNPTEMEDTVYNPKDDEWDGDHWENDMDRFCERWQRQCRLLCALYQP